jgi:hypothetical protein
MKRNSILTMVLLFSICNVGFSLGYSSSSSRNRVEWSPYAYGLICGGLQYSPYVKNIGNTGLVPDYMYYNPYAYGNGRSGLVGWCSYYEPYSSFAGNGSCQVCTQYPVRNTQIDVRSTSYVVRNTQSAIRPVQDADFIPGGQLVISKWLNSKGIAYKTERISRSEGKLISVTYLLSGCNIMIKYWNPTEILVLQQSENTLDFYNKYMESWKQDISNFQTGSGKILQVISSDNLEILAQLESFEL